MQHVIFFINITYSSFQKKINITHTW